MHKQSSVFWCCMLLFVASSLELRQKNSTNDDEQKDNSTVQYEVYLNSTRNREDEVELLQHNSHKNSTKNNNNDVQYHIHTNSSNREDNNSTQYKFRMHSTNHEEINKMLMELRINSTKIDDKNNSVPIYGNFTRIENKNPTSYELLGNSTQTESKSNSTSHEFHEKSTRNDTKNNVFPYETYDNNIPIQLCCPLGDRLVKEECVPGEGNYTFPDVYNYITSNLSQKSEKINKTVNELFQLIIYDPCRETERYLLNPDDYAEDEYMFLSNGSLYQPFLHNFLQPISYCLAVVRDKFEVTACFPSINETITEANQLTYKPVGLIVSLPFLLATFVVYSILPELRNMHGYTLRGYVGSLFVAYTVLVVLQLTHPNDIETSVCTTLAFVIHFSFLASFFWLNVMCFDIWWTFGGFRSLQGSMRQRERKKFIIYSIYAWGSASIFTIVCIIMDFVPNIPKEFIRPEFGVVRCWFNTDEAKALYFYGPMSITVICNFYLFISTALKIIRHKKDTDLHLRGSESRRHDDNKQWFNLYLKLFIVMGINWSMEIVSWLFKSTPPYIWYLTDLTNTLQGLIIFIIFVWKKKVKRLLLKRFGCQDRDVFSRNSTRSVAYHSSASRTCTTSIASGVIPLQEKVNPYVQTNCRGKNSFDEADG